MKLLVTSAVFAASAFSPHMLHSKKYPGQCSYCHSDGDTELYGCDRSQNDQYWYFDKVPAQDVAGHTNAYTIVSKAHGLCLATDTGSKVFGWSDCSTTDQGTISDRAWFVTPASHDKNAATLENAKFSGKCLASDDGWRFFLWDCQEMNDDQSWVFDPPLPVDHDDTNVTDPTASWIKVASNNGDIEQYLETGMSWAKGHSVTQTDQVSASLAFEAGGTWDVFAMKFTVTAEYMHSWADMVSQSKTTTVTSGCKATCHKSDLPKNSSGWKLFQWQLKAKRTGEAILTETCNYKCVPHPWSPRCPLDCCKDLYCQSCDDCIVNKTAMTIVV